MGRPFVFLFHSLILLVYLTHQSDAGKTSLKSSIIRRPIKCTRSLNYIKGHYKARLGFIGFPKAKSKGKEELITWIFYTISFKPRFKQGQLVGRPLDFANKT